VIWFVLALLGASLWLVLGGIAIVVSRRRFRRRSGVFACRLRPAGPQEEDGWSRTKRHAYWVHDVLLVHRGPALRRYQALPVCTIAGPVSALTAKRLGSRPMWLRLQLDDGQIVDLVARNQDIVPATGPFVTASMR
jgi:hypothetical protein